MLLRETSTREFSLIPKYFERVMSGFFFSNRNVWQPELDSLLFEIQSDKDSFNRVPLDPRIIPVVLSLRLHGITTRMSCEGHRGRYYTNPAESESPFVEFGPQVESKQDNQSKLAFAQEVIPIIRSNMGLLANLLVGPTITDVESLTDASQITPNNLGSQVYYAFQELVYTRSAIDQIKKGISPQYVDSIKLYREIKQLDRLLGDFYSEISHHYSRLNIKAIINFSALLVVSKSHENSTLQAQQREMLNFADYLLGRYLVAQKSTHPQRI